MFVNLKRNKRWCHIFLRKASTKRKLIPKLTNHKIECLILEALQKVNWPNHETGTIRKNRLWSHHYWLHWWKLFRIQYWTNNVQRSWRCSRLVGAFALMEFYNNAKNKHDRRAKLDLGYTPLDRTMTSSTSLFFIGRKKRENEMNDIKFMIIL